MKKLEEIINGLKTSRELAILYHGEQKYGCEDYVYHLDNVVNKVIFLYYETDYNMISLITVAYFHDILEDTDMSIQHLKEWCTPYELEAIQAITKVYGESLQDYYKKVCTNKISHLVKIADTLTNLEHSLKDGNNYRINKYSKQLQILSN